MVYRRRYGRSLKKKSVLERWSLTNIIILINVVVFFLVSFIGVLFVSSNNGIGVEKLISYVALSPELVFHGFVWTFITSMFMHGSFTHLFVNMVSLFFVGTFVEKLIGRKRFLWFYLISGIVAGLFFVGLAYVGQFLPNGLALFGGLSDSAVGASGAIFGLAGLLAILIPRLKVLVFFIIPMPMWLAMIVLLFGLWAFSLAGSLPIGNTAHLGGAVVGVVYGLYLRKKYSRKVKMLNRMFV